MLPVYMQPCILLCRSLAWCVWGDLFQGVCCDPSTIFPGRCVQWLKDLPRGVAKWSIRGHVGYQFLTAQDVLVFPAHLVVSGSGACLFYLPICDDAYGFPQRGGVVYVSEHALLCNVYMEIIAVIRPSFPSFMILISFTLAIYIFKCFPYHASP